jgi:hypothetical protein
MLHPVPGRHARARAGLLTEVTHPRVWLANSLSATFNLMRDVPPKRFPEPLRRAKPSILFPQLPHSEHRAEEKPWITRALERAKRLRPSTFTLATRTSAVVISMV